jgi:trimeric autotransporter adhesin
MKLISKLLGLILCSQAFALPSNPHVMQGTLMVENPDAKTCVFTVGDETFLQCDDFSIAEDELMEFRQPSSKSIVVVEVVTDRPSTLLGTLKSNGGVFIVSPPGVMIGENGSIDTYGFFASTLPACACPLIDKEMDVFVQGSSKASIVNKGRIKAWENDAYLIGYKIENRGVVDASQGTVSFAAGQDLVLNPSNGHKVSAFPSPIKYTNEETGIDNSGMIIAARTELKADGNAYSIAILHWGFIDTVGASERKGEVYFETDKGDVIISGAIAAENSDGTGGNIQILGEHLFLFENANIDASGDTQGGNVFIGTDGTLNPQITSKLTFIDEDASIIVDGVEEGNGGMVIICSEETTCFYGAVSACGGDRSGNGGTVNIFGKIHLDFQGKVDHLAPQGKEGVLLLNEF